MKNISLVAKGQGQVEGNYSRTAREEFPGLYLTIVAVVTYAKFTQLCNKKVNFLLHGNF